MVNRLWRWHFGEGLVRSPDNFGKLGEAPTNQPLLDWLARRFIEGRWSIKDMHRLIMASSTYQSAAMIPCCRRRSRQPLALANRRAAGSKPKRSTMHCVPSQARSIERWEARCCTWATANTCSTIRRRTPRNTKAPGVAVSADHPQQSLHFYQLFDSPDGTVLNGDRDNTTVAPQALFMLNSDLVTQSSERIAGSLLIGTMPTTSTARRFVLVGICSSAGAKRNKCSAI